MSITKCHVNALQKPTVFPANLYGIRNSPDRETGCFMNVPLSFTKVANGLCVGDLLYEGDDICSDSIILTGEHVFDSTGPDVMLEVSDCRVVVDSIEYN